MPVAPEELVGCHVFEVGVREDVPFVTFATGPTTRQQVRLVIESRYEVSTDIPRPSGPGLQAIMSLTVQAAEVRSGSLRLDFDHRTTLNVAGTSEVWTSEQAWWLTDWYTTPFW